MKLPISLLLLAALGEAVKLTTEKTTTTHTSKRELHEGTFGTRTELLKKYVPTETTPGDDYTADDFKHTLQGQSSTDQIFGARLPPISKISDLLSRPNPSFELALTNHLYSPVSAYAVKLPTYEDKGKSSSKGLYSKHKNFKHLKQLQEQHYDSQKNPSKEESRNPELFSSYLNSDFRSGLASPPFPFGPAFSGLNPSFTATPSPQKFPLYESQIPFGFRLKTAGHNVPLQYYQSQSQTPHASADFDFEYENQKDSHKDKEQSKGEQKSEQYNPALRHELEKQPVPIEVYSAHPNGAVSYSSYTNQAFLAGHSVPQSLYKEYPKLQEAPLASDLRQQQQFYVPQLYQPEKQHLPSPVSQQQYYPPHPQPYFGPIQQPILLYPVGPSGKLPSAQFIPIQQPQYYLSPNRQQLLQDLQQGAALQTVNLQEPPVIYKPAPTPAQPDLVETLSTHAPPAYQTVTNYQSLPENNPVRYTDQPAVSNSVENSSVRLFTPTPVTPVPSVVPLSVQPLHPTDAVPQVAITPKSHLAHDQVVKPTTVQPQTIRNFPEISQPPSQFYQDSNTLQDPQPTIQAQHSSPATFQPLPVSHSNQYSSTTQQPEVLIGAHQSHTQTKQQNTVQVQHLQLDEKHSKLAPASAESSQQPTGQDNSQPTEATPSQYQDLSTPPPTSPSTTDYEIEIASHVDHSQLPKDLRPVTASQQDAQFPAQKGQSYRPPTQFLLREGKVQTSNEALPRHVHLNHQNVASFGTNNSPFARPFLDSVQSLIQPRAFTGAQQYVLPADIEQPQVAAFQPVHYFDKFSGPVYGSFQG